MVEVPILSPHFRPKEDPVKAVAMALTEMNDRSGDPTLSFINLLTAAVIAGKFIGMSASEVQMKVLEVERPASLIAAKITGGICT